MSDPRMVDGAHAPDDAGEASFRPLVLGEFIGQKTVRENLRVFIEAARSVRIDLPPFTLVGATTRSGLITRPLRERFGIPLRLVFYEPDELELIVRRGARVLGMELTPEGASEIARRSRGTPRVAARL